MLELIGGTLEGAGRMARAAVAVALCVAASVAAGAVRSGSVVIPPRSAESSGLAHYRRVLPFWTAHVVDTFDPAACGLTNAADVAEARRLRVRAAHGLACRLRPDRQTGIPLRFVDDSRAAAALVGRGCVDPVVVHLASLCEDRWRLRDSEAYRRARAAEKDPVLRLVLWCQDTRAATAAGDRPGSPDEALRAALPAVLAGPADVAFDIYGILPCALDSRFAALPGLPPALALVDRGHRIQEPFFRAMAGDYCVAPTEAARQADVACRLSSWPAFRAAVDAAPAQPLPLRWLMGAAPADAGDGTAEGWYSRLLALDMNDAHALHVYAWHHLSSTWGGSTAAFEGFLLQAVTCGRTDTFLPYAAAQAFFNLDPCEYPDFSAWRRHYVAAGTAAVLRRAADSYLAEQDRTILGPDDPYLRLGVVAALFDHDFAAAHGYFARLADRFDDSRRWALIEHTTIPPRVRERLYRAIRVLALPADSLAPVLAVERQARAGGTSAALAAYLAIDATFKGAPPPPAALVDWAEMRIADLRAEYAAAHPGEWVPLPPTARMHEYTAPKGTQYGVGSNFLATCRNSIYGLTEFPPDDIEFRWTVHYAAEYMDAPACINNGASWGAGYRFNQMMLVGHVTIWWWSGQAGTVSLGTGRVFVSPAGRNLVVRLDPGERPPYHVRVRLREGQVAVFVNDRERITCPRTDLLIPPPPPGAKGFPADLFRNDHDAALTPTFFTERNVGIGDYAVRVLPPAERALPGKARP